MSIKPEPRQTEVMHIDHAEVVPSRDRGNALLHYIAQRVACPLRILDAGGAGAQAELQLRWWQNVRDSYQVHGEFPYVRFHLTQPVRDMVFYEYEEGPCAPVMDAHADALNISTWYPSAREEFLSAVSLFRAPVVDAKARPKHFPLPGAKTESDLAKASMSMGESVLAFGITPDHIGAVARGIEEDHFECIYGEDHSRAFVDCMCDVGFSDGRKTRWLAIEWTLGAVHGYPVSVSEVNAKAPDATARWVDQYGVTHEYEACTYSTDVLQGYPRFTRN